MNVSFALLLVLWLSILLLLTFSGVRECIPEISSERKAVCYNYRNLLTRALFRLLEAIGSDEIVSEPYRK